MENTQMLAQIKKDLKQCDGLSHLASKKLQQTYITDSRYVTLGQTNLILRFSHFTQFLPFFTKYLSQNINYIYILIQNMGKEKSKFTINSKSIHDKCSYKLIIQ